MPTLKTEVSELSVAFGILGVKPINPVLSEEEISTKFENTLPYDKYIKYCEGIEKNEELHQLSRELFILGKELRKEYSVFNNVNSLKWTGGRRQGSTVTSSQDLMVNMVPISVKVDSNVMYNRSPVNLLENLPQGLNPETRAGNWYIKVARNEFQKLYDYVVNISSGLNLPADVEEFEESASKNIRKTIQKAIGQAKDTQKKVFNDLYREMCQKTSRASAELFNDLFAKNIKTRRKNSIIEMVLKTFFRINSTPYLLMVKEGNLLLAFSIPNVTYWKSNWEFLNLTAQADTSSLQSKVIFNLEIKPRGKEGEAIAFPFHSEIRWSHGKFCGAPEAKLYKDFTYEKIPFYENIVKIDINSAQFNQTIANIEF